MKEINEGIVAIRTYCQKHDCNACKLRVMGKYTGMLVCMFGDAPEHWKVVKEEEDDRA